MTQVLEFESEPVKGIPGVLPSDERVIWQGTPTWASLLVHVLHVRWVAAYFAVIMAWRAYSHITQGNGVAVATTSAAWLGVLGLLVGVLLAGVALQMKRTTVYTITTKRLILRYGMAVPIAINVPFAKIDGVDVKALGDGTGEIPVTVGGGDQFAYAMMWPHARRWHFLDPQPMLRSVPEPLKVAGLLSDAVAATLAPGEASLRAAVRKTDGKPARPVASGSVAGPAVASAA